MEPSMYMLAKGDKNLLAYYKQLPGRAIERLFHR